MVNKCKTCTVGIPELGKTGHKKVFCSEKCKQYYSNHIRNDATLIGEMVQDAKLCSTNPEYLKEWALTYCVDKRGAFRGKVFEDLFCKATGLVGTVAAVRNLIECHPDNNLLCSLNEKFNAWKNNSTRSICPACKERWPSFSQTHWRIFCSEKCCNDAKRTGGSIRESIDGVMIEKYGVRGGFTTERVNQFNQDRFERTGYHHATQRPEIKKQILEKMSSSGRFVSKPEKEIREYFETKYGTKIEPSCHTLVPGKQIDLYFPDHKLAVEYNGCFFHSEGNGGRKFAKWRHVEKTDACEAVGVQLIHVWEDEWYNDPGKVLRMLESKLGLLKPRAYARNCRVVENPSNIDFLNKHHIQGYAKSSVCYGLELDGELVANMCFTRTSKSGVYELNRFASDNIHGAFSKLLRAFCKGNSDWREVYSFGDRCVVGRNNNVYLKNGFSDEGVSPPDYKYTSGKRDRIHKFNFRRQVLLRKYTQLDDSMTESEMAEVLGFKRIYGCGLIRFSLKR